jgi:hypothetical protein
LTKKVVILLERPSNISWIILVYYVEDRWLVNVSHKCVFM